MYKIHSALALGICLLIGFNQPVFATSKDDDPRILSAFATFDVPGDFLEIIGAGFDQNDPDPPIVTLGGIELDLVSFDANNILAELPAGLPFGDYLLIVSTDIDDDHDSDLI